MTEEIAVDRVPRPQTEQCPHCGQMQCRHWNGLDWIKPTLSVEDYVRFIMPVSREYQFAAITVVQKFVNGYGIKAINEDVSGGTAIYTMHYELAMPEEDFAFFLRIGLELNQQPEELTGAATMVIDLSDARLETLRDTDKHLVQICGVMCGVLCRALPAIRRVRILRTGEKWLYEPSMAQLEGIGNDEITGIVGAAGPETYFAASLGLAVVEIVPENEPAFWRTKWNNALYRRIVGDWGALPLHYQVEQAKASILRQLGEIIRCQAEPVQEAVQD